MGGWVGEWAELVEGSVDRVKTKGKRGQGSPVVACVGLFDPYAGPAP